MIVSAWLRRLGLVELRKPWACPVHGERMDPRELVGRELCAVVASWHHFVGRPVSGPVQVWLVDQFGRFTYISTSADWCLLVEEREPHSGFDMGEYGRFEIGPDSGRTVFARHVGSVVLAVREEHDEMVGRVALEICFRGGGVRCFGQGGDLRLAAF